MYDVLCRLITYWHHKLWKYLTVNNALAVCRQKTGGLHFQIEMRAQIGNYHITCHVLCGMKLSTHAVIFVRMKLFIHALNSVVIFICDRSHQNTYSIHTIWDSGWPDTFHHLIKYPFFKTKPYLEHSLFPSPRWLGQCEQSVPCPECDSSNCYKGFSVNMPVTRQ